MDSLIIRSILMSEQLKREEDFHSRTFKTAFSFLLCDYLVITMNAYWRLNISNIQKNIEAGTWISQFYQIPSFSYLLHKAFKGKNISNNTSTTWGHFFLIILSHLSSQRFPEINIYVHMHVFILAVHISVPQSIHFPGILVSISLCSTLSRASLALWDLYCYLWF